MRLNRRVLLVSGIALFYLSFFWFYYNRIAAFGCFDDCFNYGAGYFITKGKHLYSDLFFNHQPLMAYISAAIQATGNPTSLYNFLLFHRLFILGASFVLSLLIVYRFSYIGAGFALLYEPIKLYIFGDRFLAEALIAYIAVYVFGLVLQKGRHTVDFYVVSFLVWLIVFSREPYVPLGLVLFILFLFSSKWSRHHTYSLVLFTGLSLATIAYHVPTDYFFNVVTLNAGYVGANEVKGSNLLGLGGLQSLLYPLWIFISGKQTFLHLLLYGYSTSFVLGSAYALFKKKYKMVCVVWGVLGVAAVRLVEPGFMYYQAFHMAPWYGLFLYSCCYFAWFYVTVKKPPFRLLLVEILGITFLYSILSPQAFIYDKVDKQYEFTTNYSVYFVNGEVVKRLASANDTFFIDGFDELIHWQAQLPSGYKYTWYTSFMKDVPLYRKARDGMFVRMPPTFYYGSCPKEILPDRFMPESVKKNYQALLVNGKPSCLFVLKTKIPAISKLQWESVKAFGYELSPT